MLNCILLLGREEMLGDLDELVLRCRNAQSRDHISEAVRSYKAAAYRSAIIMTWIALVHDLVDKLRELSLHGDAAATQKIAEFDRIHHEADLRASLQFERDLLSVARKDFELISDIELTDLARIQEDRNRCAHPSINVDAEPFSPSAELARTHIRSAIECVLQHEPAQGKYAYEMVMKQVNGEYFPPEWKKSDDILGHGPLLKGRKPLVRAFMVTLLKALFRDSLDSVVSLKYLNCLSFVRRKRADVWNEFIAAEVTRIARPLDIGEHGIRLLRVVQQIPDIWEAFPEDVRVSLYAFVTQLPAEHIDMFDRLDLVRGLRAAVELRASSLTAAEVSADVWFSVPQPVWKRMVDGFCRAESFAEANTWAMEIVYYYRDGEEVRLTQQEADRICEAVISNRQVRECIKRDDVLECILDCGFAGAAWEKMLALVPDVDVAAIQPKRP